MQRFDNPDVILTDVMDSHGKWRAKKPAVLCGAERIAWRRHEAIRQSGRHHYRCDGQPR